MSNTQERIKQRREYLKKKGGAYTTLGLITFATMFCTLMTIAFVFAAAIFFPCIVVGLCFGVVTLRLAVFTHQAHRTVRQLTFVPSVTVDSLPIEEVLLRGSEEPTEEQGQLLLRGTDGSAGTAEQELLRGSQEQAE